MWWLVLTNSLIEYGITWKMGFWARLWEIILITWTEVGRSSYWGQNHSLVWDCGLCTTKRANKSTGIHSSLLLTVNIIEPAALSSFYLTLKPWPRWAKINLTLLSCLPWGILLQPQWSDKTLPLQEYFTVFTATICIISS